MKSLVAALMLMLPLAAEIQTKRLFGPETPTGPYKHPSCVEALDNGDLLLVYYGGEGEYAGGTALFMSRKKAGQENWTAPVQIARDPFYALGNGVVWQAPDGVVWLFYVVRFGETWSTSRVAARVSQDRGATWSDPSLLRLDEGWMVRGKPIVLTSGKYLVVWLGFKIDPANPCLYPSCNRIHCHKSGMKYCERPFQAVGYCN